MSLRTRLLAGLIVLAGAGLGVMSAVTYTGQRSFLLKRTDQETVAAVDPVSFGLDQRGIVVPGTPQRTNGSPGGGGLAPPRGDVNLPPGTYGERRDGAGHVVGHFAFSYGQAALPAPKLPANIPLTTRGGASRLITVASVGSTGLRYRVASILTRDQPGTTVAAVPLRDVDQALSRLRRDEALVGGVVLAALAILSLGAIKVGMRPLDRIADTARAIAGGDLSRRVSAGSERTEVGRLGLALNAMLGQIERAFAERQASEDRLRRFIADASHELRTPLMSIRGYAELFRIGAAREPRDVEKAMTRIEDEATRMGALVEELLILARLDREPHPASEAVDLSRLAADAVDDARATAPDRRISLQAPNPARVHGDPGQLRQVLANLTRNALVHTPAGTPVEVSVARNGERVRLEVRDHGHGLPPGSESSVFERFWRAEAGRGRGPAGAGLGLSIVATIASSHGGEATAANAPGGGASFVVTLPAAL